MFFALLMTFVLASALVVGRYGLPLWFALALLRIRFEERLAPPGSLAAQVRNGAGAPCAARAYCRALARGVVLRCIRGERQWFRSISAQRAETRPWLIEGAMFAEAALKHTGLRRPRRRSEGCAAGGERWAWPRHFGLGLFGAVRYGRNPEEVLRLAQTVDPWRRYLCMEGYGFRFALFGESDLVRDASHFAAIPGYYRRAAFQGVGRALYLLHVNDLSGLIRAVGNIAADHEADIAEGAAFQAAVLFSAEPARIIALARAVPYEWRPHAHLGLVLGLRSLVGADPHLLHDCLARLPEIAADALRQAIRICDELESHVRGLHPVSGYGLWRELAAARLQEEQVLELCYAAEGRRENRGLVS